MREDQLQIIEKIPAEGALRYQYKGDDLLFEQSAVDTAADTFFTGKTPPAVKTATIMMGAPGAGKTTYALEWLRNLPENTESGTVFVGYNEGGAEAHFSPFLDAMNAEAGTLDRLDVAKRFQPVTQRIQNETLKRALREEFSILMDVTAAGRGAGFLIDALRNLDYRQIDLVALHAPFAVSADRVYARTRPADLVEDLVGKRAGVLAFFEAHAAKCNSARFYSNSVDGEKPTLMLEIADGAVRVTDKALVKAFQADIESDVAAVGEYVRHMKSTPAYAHIDAEKLIEDYKDASVKAAGFLQKLTTPGPAADTVNKLAL